jgi:integrase
VKKTVNGRQKILGYFDTFEHGIAYISSVNASPLLDDDITFSELFARWKATKYDRISLSSRKSYDNAYRHCRKLHNLPFRSIRYGHLQDVVDEIQAGYCTQKKCRVLMSQLYQFAIKREMATTDYSRYVEIDRHRVVYKKKPFTVREINRLWKQADDENVQDVLILIYTGLRIGEYLSLRPQDIKIRERYLDIRHSKTEAGVRRVPISQRILPFLAARKRRREICPADTYDAFRRRWNRVMKRMSMHHTPHECRHTLATLLDRAEVNETTVRMILGHARQGVTKGVYTHKSLADLRKVIDRV